MVNIEIAKQQVLEASQKAFQEKLFAGTSGNLSIFVREEKAVVITPTSVRYETMTIDDIVVIDLDGNTISGNHGPSSESLMHVYIYRGNDNINAIVHTHSPYATAFAVNQKPIPYALVEMKPFLGGDVRVARLERAGSKELGVSAAIALENRGACLLANHGVVAVGSTMDQAYIRAEYAEDAAKICNLASITGEVKEIDF